MTDTQVYASPSDAPWLDDPEMTFWRPSRLETFKLMTWRQWAGLLPILALMAVLALCLWIHAIWILVLKLGFKLIAVTVGLVATTSASVAKKAMTLREDPFCIRCGYSLLGLPDGHRCPECGLPVSLAIIREYQRDPENFLNRWKARHRVYIPSAVLEVPANARRRKSRDGT
jgi:hypothetical protein